MTRARRFVFVLGTAALVACGGTNSGNNGDIDAAGSGGPDGPHGTPDASPNTPDAAPPGGVAAIHLTSPDGLVYTAQLDIESQKFGVIVDTGSSTLAVAGSSCSGCTGASPKYTPGSMATDLKMTASAQYGSGSWNGELFSDTLGFGAGTSSVKVSFASMTSQTGFFDGSNQFQGLMGLGPDALLTKGTTSYLDALAKTGMTDVEAFQLCDSGGGTMWLGGYDPAATSADPQYTPMSSQLPYYAMTISSMKLGTTDVGFTSSSAIADTGTSLFYTSSTVANNILTQVNKATTLWTGAFTNQQGIYCGTAKSGVTATQIDAAMPPMTLTLPGATGGSFTVSAPATRSYLLDVGSGMWCIGVTSDSSIPAGFALFGDMGLRGFVTIFDRVHKQIGLAPEKGCAGQAFRAVEKPVPARERGHLPNLSGL